MNEKTKNSKFARRLGGSTIFEGPGPFKSPKIWPTWAQKGTQIQQHAIQNEDRKKMCLKRGPREGQEGQNGPLTRFAPPPFGAPGRG